MIPSLGESLVENEELDRKIERETAEILKLVD
jgi:hypothetical protein